MKRVILGRLLPWIEANGTTGSYRALGRGRRWALLWVRLNDPRINADDWRRKAGG